jgi:hypothetical protein
MKAILFLLLLMPSVSASAQACGITLSSGGDLRAATISHAGQIICLNSGTYNLGPSTLVLAPSTTIQGLGLIRDNVIINSSAQRAIVTADNVVLKNFLLSGAPQPNEFGVLVAHDNVLLWSLRIQFFKINIGVIQSNNVGIWDTFLSDNGDLTDGLPNPNVWINQSSNVTIFYGTFYGRANGPFGDGEVAAHNSSDVRIEGTQSIDAGASSFYFVNCDDCEIQDALSERSDEWGLDVVQGSDNFYANGNSINNAYFGGAVFTENTAIGGTFTNNIFSNNNSAGGFCNGINVVGLIAGVVQRENTATPGPVICVVP